MEALNMNLEKSRRVETAFIYFGYAAFSLYLSRPIDWIGIVITLVTIFPLLLAIPIFWVKWIQLFGKNNIFTVFVVLLVLGVFLVLFGIAFPALRPFIGEHFA